MEHLPGTSEEAKREMEKFEKDWDWHTEHCRAYLHHLRMTKDPYFVDMAIEGLQELGIEIPRELDLMNNNVL